MIMLLLFMMKNWDMIDLDNKTTEYIIENRGNIKIKIIPHRDKNKYKLIQKFKLGEEK